MIESFFITNLAFLAAWCEYNCQQSTTYVHVQSIIVYLLVEAALLLFVIIVLTRVIIKVKVIIIKHVCPRRNQPVDVPFEQLLEQLEDTPPVVTSTYIDIKQLESETENTRVCN